MNTMSQFEVPLSIITIHAAFSISDITGSQGNLFGVVGKTRRLCIYIYIPVPHICRYMHLHLPLTLVSVAVYLAFHLPVLCAYQGIYLVRVPPA